MTSVTAFHSSKLRQNGFGMIELMLMLAVTAVPIVAAISLNLHLIDRNREATDIHEIEMFKRNIVSLITDDLAWAMTVQKNPNMDCINNASGGTPPPLGKGGACDPDKNKFTFDLWDRGTIYYQASDLSRGISSRGAECTGFPSVDCPFRYHLEWVPMNTDPFPVIGVIVELKIGMNGNKPFSKLKFNPFNFSFMVPPGEPWPPADDKWPSTIIYKHAK